MGDQEFLFRSGVFTVVALEGPVVGMGQLVVEQQLLVVTTEVAKLTLEPGTCTLNSYLTYHHTNVKLNYLFKPKFGKNYIYAFESQTGEGQNG